jgi:hypothetical protein
MADVAAVLALEAFAGTAIPAGMGIPSITGTTTPTTTTTPAAAAPSVTSPKSPVVYETVR